MKAKKNRIGLKNFLIVIFIIAIGLAGYYWYTTNQTTQTESVYDQYSVLSSYLTVNGYTCGSLLTPGSKCEKQATINSYEFFRFDDGFQYMTTSKNYKVNILVRQGSSEYSIQTYDGAFEGYQNKKYFCTTINDAPLGQIDKCITENIEILDNDVYLTVVKTAIREIDTILEHSGYDASKVITQFKWEK